MTYTPLPLDDNGAVKVAATDEQQEMIVNQRIIIQQLTVFSDDEVPEPADTSLIDKE